MKAKKNPKQIISLLTKRVPTQHGKKKKGIDARHWIVQPYTPTLEPKNPKCQGKKKKSHWSAMQWGRKKWHWLLSQGRKKNSSHSSSNKNRWEPSESLKLVSSVEQMKLVDLVSFLLLGWLFQGLGLRLSDSSSSCWPPIDLPPANCPLWSWSKIEPVQVNQRPPKDCCHSLQGQEKGKKPCLSQWKPS